MEPKEPRGEPRSYKSQRSFDEPKERSKPKEPSPRSPSQCAILKSLTPTGRCVSRSQMAEFSPRPVSLTDLCFYLIFLIVLIRGSPHGGGDVGIFICSDVSSLCLPIGVAS